ncbi:recombination-associated protein RdgC [Taurinivorans muris]|uniref:Recombination-associated protein RdgC n=1 Tax=Taurinivorans muris TaxID=2787751 RepID=A0ABY5Y2S4_9BACT|nr:recombination-associated protein RdgC [Desulfovibrionaceae bacterium LT0009]
MSFLKNTTSFSLFKIENLPDGILGSFGEKLRQFAFMPIDDTVAERSYGWTSMEDMEDYEFINSFEINKYFYFAFRVDSRNIAPAVFKRYLQLALEKEQRELAKTGHNYISKERKKEIKEQVKLELLAKTLPTPAVYEVIWDFTCNIIYFACTNKKMIELFGNYFLKTLGIETKEKGEQLTFADFENTSYFPSCDVKLYQLTPYNRWVLLTEDNKELAHELDKLFPTAFSGTQPFDIDRNENRILGEEFLTWLWYRADMNIHFQFVDEKAGKEFYVIFENKMSVRGSNGENSLLTSLSGSNNPMDEARLGLGLGKKVNNACIVLSDKDISFIFSLNAKNFSFSSFSIIGWKNNYSTGSASPRRANETETTLSVSESERVAGRHSERSSFEEIEFDAHLLEKMQFFERAKAYFDIVYHEFIKIRLDKTAWKKETEDIRTWIIQFSKKVSKQQLINMHEHYMKSING